MSQHIKTMHQILHTITIDVVTWFVSSDNFFKNMSVLPSSGLKGNMQHKKNDVCLLPKQRVIHHSTTGGFSSSQFKICLTGFILFIQTIVYINLINCTLTIKTINSTKELCNSVTEIAFSFISFIHAATQAWL